MSGRYSSSGTPSLSFVFCVLFGRRAWDPGSALFDYLTAVRASMELVHTYERPMNSLVEGTGRDVEPTRPAGLRYPARKGGAGAVQLIVTRLHPQYNHVGIETAFRAQSKVTIGPHRR